jgi:hypothetical protein
VLQSQGNQDQVFRKEESASNVQVTRTVDGIQEENNTEADLIDAPQVMNIGGHCHQVPLPQSDGPNPNHDEVHNLLAEKQVSENMQSKSKTCGLFILSHQIEHITNGYNKMKMVRFEQDNHKLNFYLGLKLKMRETLSSGIFFLRDGGSRGKT